MSKLEFQIRDEQNDLSVQIRIQKISNGFIVRTGKLPFYYPNIEEAADDIKKQLISSFHEFDEKYKS